ncbi:OmpA family protein [Sorangium sp. So ce131]|uniref:OmpA family protein n=1 Tax=Sorangium sp. So ce131 TaxID=3133282 RepID=UPI003F5FB664
MACWPTRARVTAPLVALPLLVASASVLVSKPAAAQRATPLDRLAPAPAGDVFLSVPSAGVTGELRPAGGLVFSYSHQPLTVRGTSPSLGSVAWVERQVVLHALASVELMRRFKLDLDAPFVLDQGGASGSVGSLRLEAPSGAALGDLQAGARVSLVPQEGLRPAAAIGLSVWVPTGDDAAFSGAGSVRYAPRVIVGAEHPVFRWSATAGGRFQEASAASLTGSEVFVAAGAGVRRGPLQLGSELSLWAAVDDAMALGGPRRAGAELLLTARWSLGPLTFDAGAGPGLGRLPGVPKARFFAAIGVAADVVPAARAAPPATPAGLSPALEERRRVPSKPVIPVADLDGDSVPDAEDVCPRVVGEASPPAGGRRGCPADRDDDKIYDIDDRCPDVPGESSAVAEKNGCPADTDGDGVPNAADACPYERGRPSEDRATHGCPFAVRIEGSQIVILQQVQFALGRAEIEPESFELLSEVAAVLQEHPEIARVAVDGHTDNSGTDRANLSLSQRRALAVVAWLTAHGIDARRLEARGFGARRPIADNRAAEGRARNRRVEFQIRRRTDEGAAGWKDGPLE